MFGSRRGRPSLIGSAARTAGRTAVVSTANAMTRPRGDGAAPADVPTEAMAAAVAAAPAPATGGMTDEAIARLKQLAELHAAGILTEAEFAEQKAKVLVP